MKKLTVLLTVLALLMVFAGCQGIGKTGETTPSAELLTQQEVLQIALDHAGVKAEDATDVQMELDYDDGVSHYDVEFRSGDYEYSYEIDKSGKILEADKDLD